ncbi:MAG: C40 family peptidase [Bacteroidales bacterium]|nr:C40 family peptidase [Bacteroidales bacterium]
MNQAICLHPLIPIRSEPNHKAEQASQLLFGETVEVIEQNGDWLNVTTDFDHFCGWIEERSVVFYTGRTKDHKMQIISKPYFNIQKENQNIIIPAGSEIPSVRSGDKFTLANNTFYLKDHLPPGSKTNRSNLLTTSKQFLNAPYLWGGRTIFGFDCSGFVQTVCKIHELPLPRDAKDQAEKGENVKDLNSVLPGDLLFFRNQENKISHVGIYAGENKIIHASISVRMDSIDEKGIYNNELHKHTHELFSIKRLPVP